ncbi:MAG TPA: DUF6600 domain-containing protein [Candidatus Sulfotelmatobacter sp.]|nr:DUF6600 domain-containing protein [Candidatus Sulfotelmatobacter sp.]
MSNNLARKLSAWNRQVEVWGVISAILLFALVFQIPAAAQDQDDPPGRVARLGYIEGSVSFQPAGEDEWVQAVPNRPITTGDKLWADRDSRAELQLGSATIHIGSNTGFSILNLDDRTTQIELSAGSMNVRVWDLDRDDVFEIDTANQAFTIFRPGRYRVDAAEDGNSTVVMVREGEGESTGNGQSYTMHAGQRFTFRGTNSLNAEVDEIGRSDDFDDWADRRERRYHDSPSARYCDRRVVGYQDLDDYGDWRPTPDYGYAWFPRVDAGWAPYHTGHWAWIDPWGWTWVDDNPWGYAPFHYGRWAFVYGRWGWIPGPREVRPVYAPALVAFVGGGMVAGGTVAWFPLGPREVYVPSYRVSPAYVNRVNVTNTTVNQTTVTNVYNTTVINNNSTTINNVTYANRNVNGAVMAVPQRSFANAQPVAQSAVRINQQQLRAMPVSARAAVSPARESVLGVHANTANRVAAPPPSVTSRPVIAKTAPPPPPPSFAARQQVLAQHPGVPIARQELTKLRPANTPAAREVRVAPPAKPAQPTPAANRPAQPGNPAANTRPGGNPPPAAQPAPANRPGAQPNQPPARNERPAFNPANNRPQPNQPAPNARPEPNAPPARNDRPPSAQPNRPQPNQPAPNNRPEPNAPPARNDRPSPQPNRPEPAPNNRPESARPSPPPASNDRPPSAQPYNRPDPNQPRANEPMPAQSQPNMGRPDVNRPQPNRPEPPMRNERPSEQPRTEPAPRPQSAPPMDRPQPRQQSAPPMERPQSRPPEARPAPQERAQPQRQAPPSKQDQKNEDKKPH